MTETTRQMARRVFNECRWFVKTGRKDVIVHLSGSGKRRTSLKNEYCKILDDTNIDYELGILTKEEYEEEIKALNLFQKSICNYEVH